jgi:hypothetical protein
MISIRVDQIILGNNEGRGEGVKRYSRTIVGK